MKKIEKISLVFIIMLLVLVLLTKCYAAYLPFDKNNLTNALTDIENELGVSSFFSISDTAISATWGSQSFSFDYDVDNQSFSKEIVLSGNESNEDIENDILFLVYGYVAVSDIQGKSCEDSFNYYMSEMIRLNDYVKGKLSDEGQSSNVSSSSSDSIHMDDFSNGSPLESVVSALLSHEEGDITYSDNYTLSLKIEKVRQDNSPGKIVASLQILNNDFLVPSSASKSMGYNLNTIIVNNNGSQNSGNSNNSGNINSDGKDEDISATADKVEKDNTISNENKIPQTGRSYTINYVLFAIIVIAMFGLVGIYTFDKKKKQN